MNYLPTYCSSPSSAFCRFGFNGQEKDNEIAGIGNSNTAQFWQYDTRLGRRWNVDPVDQISISNYATFGNNPIINVDPNGAHHYYNELGQWTHSDTKLSNGQHLVMLKFNSGYTGEVYMSIANVNASHSAHKCQIDNVLNHLAKKAGIKTKYNGGKGIVGARFDEENSAIAYHDPATDNIWAVLSGYGFLHESFSSYWNAISTFEHEKFHKDGTFPNTYKGHAQVYLQQILSPTFKKTSKSYQEKRMVGFAQRLLNSTRQDYNSASRTNGANIENEIDDFNNANIGSTISWRGAPYNENSGLRITNSDGSYIDVEYEKLDNAGE